MSDECEYAECAAPLPKCPAAVDRDAWERRAGQYMDERDRLAAELAEARGLFERLAEYLSTGEPEHEREVIIIGHFLSRTAGNGSGSMAGGCRCGSDGSPYAPCVCGGRRATSSESGGHA